MKLAALIWLAFAIALLVSVTVYAIVQARADFRRENRAMGVFGIFIALGAAFALVGFICACLMLALDGI